MAMLAAAIVAVIAINGAFCFWQEYRAEETMAALQRLLPHQVRALRNGTTVVLASDDVVPGDVIFLTAGDDVPADCRLVKAFGVRVNNATVTGEARPVSRDARPSTEADLLRSRNVVLAGTSLTSGEAKALVFATGMHTAFGRIAHLTQTTADAGPRGGAKGVRPLARKGHCRCARHRERRRDVDHAFRQPGVLGNEAERAYSRIGANLDADFDHAAQSDGDVSPDPHPRRFTTPDSTVWGDFSAPLDA
jgi:magnesium-transporting ATPase (P-type)